MLFFYIRQCLAYLFRKTTLKLSPYCKKATSKIRIIIADEFTDVNLDIWTIFARVFMSFVELDLLKHMLWLIDLSREGETESY